MSPDRLGVIEMSKISIDKYVTELDNGMIVYRAVAGKKKYDMPEDFKDMYDDKHLAIQEVTCSRAEMFGVNGDRYYIPLLTE